ncbi:hypothetical protein Tco_0401081 [Tanacetum coccineum]
MDREIMQDLERGVGYGIIDTWEEMPVDMQGHQRLMTQVGCARDDRSLHEGLGKTQKSKLSTVGWGWFKCCIGIRRTLMLVHTLIDGERRLGCLERLVDNLWMCDLTRSEVMSLHTTVLGQQAVITELKAADCRRQTAIIELLAVDCRRQAQFIEALKLLKGLKTQMTEF